jgi:hypothetical protein
MTTAAEDWSPLDPAEAHAVEDPGAWFRALPTSLRIDLVLAAAPTPPGGWSVAELAGCTRAAIYARQSAAVRALRAACSSRGLAPFVTRRPL